MCQQDIIAKSTHNDIFSYEIFLSLCNFFICLLK
nr:MAG TPA: hypothetical protein [Caudoviricetes sp.]